jgi:hypothetical protein
MQRDGALTSLGISLDIPQPCCAGQPLRFR